MVQLIPMPKKLDLSITKKELKAFFIKEKKFYMGIHGAIYKKISEKGDKIILREYRFPEQ